YTYDSMGRLNTMAQALGPEYQTEYGTRPLPAAIVNGVNYGPADELLSIVGDSGYLGETRTYNSLLQLTSVADGNYGLQFSMQYTYPTDGTNIGKTLNQTNVVSGEEVQYEYDSLGRMTSAQTTAASRGTAWGYSYVYDSFGNLSAKNVTLGSPSASWAMGADGANHIFGYTYDANGNLTGSNSPGPLYNYDVENRLTDYLQYDISESYGYDPSNKRIQKQLAEILRRSISMVQPENGSVFTSSAPSIMGYSVRRRRRISTLAASG